MHLPVFPATSIPMLKQAQQAWREIKQHRSYKSYQHVGRMLDFARREIMHHVGTNDPNSGHYRKAFAEWRKQSGFADIDSATVSHLLYLQDPQFSAVADMIWAGLSEKERRSIATPRPMVNRVKAYFRQFEEQPKRRASIQDAAAAHNDELRSSQDHDPEAVAAHFLSQRTAREVAGLIRHHRDDPDFIELVIHHLQEALTDR